MAEHTAPIKGKYIEAFGYYDPARNPKIFQADQDRVTHWMSRGAKPSDTVAALLKQYLNMGNMAPYMEPRTKQRKKKTAGEKKTTPATTPAT